MPKYKKPKPKRRPTKRAQKVAWKLDNADWKHMIADKDHGDDRLRAKFSLKGIDFIVPYRDNRVHRSYKDRSKLRCYKWRWKLERTNAWLKKFGVRQCIAIMLIRF